MQFSVLSFVTCCTAITLNVNSPVLVRVVYVTPPRGTGPLSGSFVVTPIESACNCTARQHSTLDVLSHQTSISTTDTQCMGILYCSPYTVRGTLLKAHVESDRHA